MTGRLHVRFWGVRGSTPTPRRENLGYGGNTSCVEIVSDGESVILDAGTGIRALDTAGQGMHVLLSHFHRDHIEGIPFFQPLYRADQRIAFYATGRWGPLQHVLAGQMATPYFPVGLDAAASVKEFVELGSEQIRIGPFRIQPFPLHHPQGSTGYRIEAAGATVVYATDHEAGDQEFDKMLRAHAEGADALICDAQYTPEEYEDGRKGWGHSTWRDAVRIAADARVGRLILFHHDPVRADSGVDAVVEQARQKFAVTDAAREGGELCL